SRVQLRTRNLARACEFYECVSGFQVARHERFRASLSASGSRAGLAGFSQRQGRRAPFESHDRIGRLGSVLTFDTIIFLVLRFWHLSILDDCCATSLT